MSVSHGEEHQHGGRRGTEGSIREMRLYCFLLELISDGAKLRRHVHVRGLLHPATLHVAIAGIVVKTHGCVEHDFLDLAKT